jgi:hypothetical protein
MLARLAPALPSLIFALGITAFTAGLAIEFGIGYALIVGGLLLAALSWLFVRGSWISSHAS